MRIAPLPDREYNGLTHYGGSDDVAREQATKPAAQIVDSTLAEYSADPDRVYLTGLSYCGFGAWYMASHYPERWAAVVPICGAGERDPVHKIGATTWCVQNGRWRLPKRWTGPAATCV